MIKEYIVKLSEENNEDLNKLERQMKDLLGELSCAEKWTESLQRQNNSYKSIFSPRNVDDEIAQKIEKAADSVQSIKKQIEYVRDLIETHLKKKSEYEKMLDEIEKSTEEYDFIRDSDIEFSMKDISEMHSNSVISTDDLIKFLSGLYKRTQLCLDLLSGDKNKCKRELNGLKYDIKKYCEQIEKSSIS